MKINIFGRGQGVSFHFSMDAKHFFEQVNVEYDILAVNLYEAHDALCLLFFVGSLWENFKISSALDKGQNGVLYRLGHIQILPAGCFAFNLCILTHPFLQMNVF